MGCEPFRIAVVGAGRMGQVHLAALRRSRTVTLAGVVEPDAETRDRLADVGSPMYADIADLLDQSPPDGVLIASSSDQHPTLVATCAAAGIPMLCEKPLGVRAADARGAARCAREAGVLLQVGYWRRFVPELRALRDRLRSGELGEVIQLACMQWDAELPSEEFRSRSGGICVDMGVHEVDQARWLVGQEFDWLTAVPAGQNTMSRPASDPDSATIVGRLSGGAAVTISLGRHFPVADSCWVEIWCTSGYERVPFMWGDAGAEVFETAMMHQAEAFARAARGEPMDGAGADDAVAALVVTELAARSLMDGVGARSPRPVPMSFAPGIGL
jgi:myo-inositol 2-dehydrogenase/D-chiro-inositol 1-dehydrogenase